MRTCYKESRRFGKDTYHLFCGYVSEAELKFAKPEARKQYKYLRVTRDGGLGIATYRAKLWVRGKK